MKRRVGILGGTFDPPHIGHFIMGNEAYHALNLDEVRFMPSHAPPHKKISGGATGEQRLEMLRRGIGGIEHFTVETIEFERSGPSYTYDTMNVLTKREPDTEFFFIIGGDMIDSLESWAHIGQLTDLVQFVGIHRPGYQSKTHLPVTMVAAPSVELSSTVIRERLREGRSIEFLVPGPIITYMKEEHLYET